MQRGVIFLDANVCAGLSFICLSVHALGVARRLSPIWLVVLRIKPKSLLSARFNMVSGFSY